MRIFFSLFRCTSAEMFFSCCGIVAAQRQKPGHHDQVPASASSPGLPVTDRIFIERQGLYFETSAGLGVLNRGMPLHIPPKPVKPL
jgi:hypothetical protein